MTSIQPELWVDRGAEAVTFYQAAFGATVLHRVGDGEDIVAQLADRRRRVLGLRGRLSRPAHPPQGDRWRYQRTLLIVDDPEAVFHHAVAAGATRTAPGKTNTAGGLPGSQTRSAINGKSGAPRHLAATPTLTTTRWRMPAQAAVPARADHLVQRPLQMAARAPSSPSRSANPVRQARKACNRT